jgi:hypothetical protein
VPAQTAARFDDVSEGRSAEVLERYSKFQTIPNRLERIRKAVVSSPLRPRDRHWEPQALNRRLPADELAQIIEEYQAGIGATTLARVHGISENGLRGHLTRCGIAIRPLGKVTEDAVAEMARLRVAGWTYKAIGERFGITRSAVSLRLKKP